jgi:RNA polymerase sigma factor (sigma-70 family)
MSARLRAWFRSAPVTVASSEAEAADGDLVRRFADTHDEAAFAELVRRHGPMVLATCRRVLYPDVHSADDAFQATFLVLATKAAGVSPPERVGAWLHGVAVHVAKKAKSWVRKIAPSAPSDLDKVPAALADPDAAEVRAKLDDVLAGLPSKYRSAVVLCELEGRSRTEAAAVLGWSEGTLSSRLARARKLLADRLARRGVVLPAAGLGVVWPASAALATVPAQLAASTVRTATLVAAGAATGEAIPAAVAALAQGVPTMHTATFKLFAASVALVGLALVGFGIYALTAADPSPQPDKPLTVAAPVPLASVPRWVEKHTFTHKAAITAVAVGPDLVATGDQTGVLVLWDEKTGKEKETLLDLAQLVNPDKPISALRFSADGTKLLAVIESGKSIKEFAVVEKDRRVHSFDMLQEWKTVGITATGDGWVHLTRKLSSAAISPNRLGDSFIRWFCFHQFPHDDALLHAAAANSSGTIFTVTGDPVPHRANVNVLPSKNVLRARNRMKGESLWEVKLGKIDIVTGLVASRDGKLVAVTDSAGRVWVFDAKTGKEVATTDKLTGAVWSAAFSPDGKQIVVGCDDKTARVYDTATGKELFVLKGHTEAVGAVAFSADGKQIVTGSGDKTVKVWEYK